MGVKRALPTLQRLMRAVESGDFAIPKGWDVLMRYPTETLRLKMPLTHTKTPHSQGLIKEFYDKYPLAKMQPLDLSSTEKPLARVFTERQLQLMASEGLSRDEARSRVEMELQHELHQIDSAGKGAGVFLRMVQQEEEAALQGAAKSLHAARHRLTGSK